MHDAINATRSKCVKKYFILGSSCLLLLLFLQHYSYGRKFISLSRSFPDDMHYSKEHQARDH